MGFIGAYMSFVGFVRRFFSGFRRVRCGLLMGLGVSQLVNHPESCLQQPSATFGHFCCKGVGFTAGLGWFRVFPEDVLKEAIAAPVLSATRCLPCFICCA